MVISGMYIETIEGAAVEVAMQLKNLEGVEVHHIEEETNKIVLTLEAHSVDKSYHIADTFKLIEGVLSTCLVYSNFEEDPFYKKADGFQ
ncbi:chaperone NapD [Pseudoneobacillus rhizosphaerae]|uniref:Chaperone NapD n=1 Tax=Pseudoneobacillus rhizosphaerae TaxID=2880968 RepID=A0A9C7LCF1_9BACI|nr:chaperone NapD [Pseudoneobacillus rhizosphaerae]CAG9610227.1 Chaperone NapD [Pseudoneobacillus rhizosphaerae]